MSLTATETARLHAILDAMEQELERELKAHRPQDAPQDGSAGDDVIASELSDDAVAQYRHQHEEWQALQRARARLVENIADVCMECGCEIPFSRLEVEPTAERCIACQETLEAEDRRLRRRGPISL